MLLNRLGLQYAGISQHADALIHRVQRLVWSALDGAEAVLGQRDPLTPPRRLMNVGSNQLFLRSDFNSIGAELLRLLVQVGGLKPEDDVLDVGCGVGRMASQLTRYLSPDSRYEGFDIVLESIDWCRENVTPRFPHFRFTHADIFNSVYNPVGLEQPYEYRFPYGAGQFSFVFMTSVVTHLLTREVEHYLRETQRVLAPGGRCLITWFLIDSEAQQAIGSRRSSLDFKFSAAPGVRVINRHRPEAAVAFEEPLVRELYRNCGLVIREPIHRGSWRGSQESSGFQDVVIATK